MLRSYAAFCTPKGGLSFKKSAFASEQNRRHVALAVCDWQAQQAKLIPSA